MSIYTYNLSIGTFIIAANDSAVTMVKLYDPVTNAVIGTDNVISTTSPSRLTDKTAKQLDEYFNGKRFNFEIPLDPKGTVFQQAVWNALGTIPYGQTRSYKQIALMLDKPNACRAVGLANNRNPIWIIIPCHRVIGTNGALVGYGGGLEIKRKLLHLENPDFIELK